MVAVASAFGALLLGACDLSEEDRGALRPSPRPRPAGDEGPTLEGDENRNIGWENRVAQIRALGPERSAAEPGSLRGMEATHAPRLTVDGRLAEVVVDHEMRPPRPEGAGAHFVGTLWLEAETGVLALYDFAPTDAAPPNLTVRLPRGVKSLRAFAWCNVHGLWGSAPVALP